ncbi:LacI family DNA-binding transcriptional regulator [Hahella ganghwensis]|uniref:LacI family DNA-binding transcriptional regulator n=1 Tax=Hahella ganghwensis TaxID=286420 RepID=UPI0005275EE7|nr:LacI family DNA-binding transcriptional regulator [Hahella ganghwensis]
MTTKNTKATIADIARRVNMTTTTVSRALNKPELVKQETLERIQAVARELNYVPNAFARNLKNSNSGLIGIVTSSLYHPFYGQMIKAISREAKKRHYTIMLFDTDATESIEAKAIETLLSYQVDGIILSAISDDEDYKPGYLDQLQRSNIPVVQVDRQLNSAPFSGVYLDNYLSGYRGGQYLLSQGHRHVLAVAGPKKSQISILRYQGLHQALEDSPEPTNIEVRYGDYTQGPAYEEVKRYLDEGNRPDAIFAFNVMITLGIMKAMRELDLSMDDIPVFGIDELPNADIFNLRFPCIYHDASQLGEMAVEMLLHQIDHPGTRSKDRIVRGMLQAPANY